MFYKPFFFSVLLLILSMPLAVAHAESGDDFYTQQALDRYFPLPEDAHTMGLASTTAATCFDSGCIFLNPAGLGFLAQSEASLTFGSGRIKGDEFLTDESIEQPEKKGYITGAFPLGSRDSNLGTFAAAYSRYLGTTNDRIGTAADGYRSTLAYGIAGEEWAIGYSFSFFDDQLHSALSDLHSHARFAHLFGVQYRPREDLAVGATFKLGIGQSDTSDSSLETDGLSHLRQYLGTIGVTHGCGNFKNSASFEYMHAQSNGNLQGISDAVVVGSDEHGDSFSIGVGSETEIFHHTFARLGARYTFANYHFERAELRPLGGDVNGPTWAAGLGYRFGSNQLNDIRLDYAFKYRNAGKGDIEHLVSLVFPFGKDIRSKAA